MSPINAMCVLNRLNRQACEAWVDGSMVHYLYLQVAVGSEAAAIYCAIDIIRSCQD